MATDSRPLEIGGSLGGERIFITGATGFLGKVLVEKLLWAVPDVGKLILLVRPDSDRRADQRLREELLDSPVMARLRALYGGNWESWAASKVEAVAGDLSLERFGLTPEAYGDLAQRVDRVVASAATVTFDERLDRALALNTRGAQRTLELARAAGDVPLLHVSTCFVSGRRQGEIAEEVAGSGLELESTLAELEAARDALDGEAAEHSAMVAAGTEQAKRLGFHDVYTLTKALAEQLLDRDRGAVPLAIVRPAIVESAETEPIPGWIEAVRVSDPLLVAYGRGLSQDFAGSADARLDLVPVDHVVNTMIAALAELDKSRAEAPPAVYQVGSSRNPITLGELLAYAREGFAHEPLRDENGEPIAVGKARFVEAERYRQNLAARRNRVAKLARLFGSSKRGRRLAASERTLSHFLRLFEVYSPYLDHGARYDDSATRALWSRLSDADRAAFPFDISSVDWRSYVTRAHIPGLIRFALRAESGAPRPAPVKDPVAEGHRRGEFAGLGASNLFELLESTAEADPNAIAFQTCRAGRWLRYSYGQALTTTANVAMRLSADYGIGPGDRVVLWGTASPEWVLTSFAVHRLGAVTVPLDPQWPVAEVEAAAKFADAKLVCAAPPLAASGGAELNDAGLPVVALAAPFVPEPDVALLPGAGSEAVSVGADDLASILFTSGTTVAPKAVPLTHGNFLANVRDLVPVMDSSRERLLSVLPIHHVFEFMVGLLVPLVGGGTISYLPELKPTEISWMMGVTRPTVLVAVPRLVGLLDNGIRQSVAAGAPFLPLLFKVLFALSKLSNGANGHRYFGKVHQRFGGELRRIATGGSALEASLGRRFQLMGFEVAEGYGMTETSPVLTVNQWGDICFGSVGRPIEGVEVEIRPSSEIADPGPGVGEIWVRGDNVMSGYYGNPEATEAAMDDGWLNTGDVGYFGDDGRLRIEGRTKDVIVTDAGKNVYPEEVELRYSGLPGVEELVVLGMPGSGGGERVTGVAVPMPGASEEEIAAIPIAIEARSAEVPSYQQISQIEVWKGELPKTTTLKVKRGLLREALLAGERGGAAKKPEPAAASEVEWNEDQEWVVGTVARVTRTRPDLVTATDRLAELGVDSLTRVELVSELEGRLGAQVDDETAAALSSVQDLFDLVSPGRSD